MESTPCGGFGPGPRRLLAALTTVAALVGPATAATAAAAAAPRPALAQLRHHDWIRVRRGPQLPPAYGGYRTTDPFEEGSEDPWLEGRYVGISGDTLLLGVSGDVTVPVALRPVPPVVQLRRRVGHRAGRGALIGGGIGFATGVAIAGLDDDGPVVPPGSDDDILDDREIGELLAAPAVGAGLGALVGYTIGEHAWEDVRVAPRRAGGAALWVTLPLRGPGGG